ncbi:prepilin-type N-terminal cleavage/methylation domain-containing protein [Tepidimonas taiwanensis]|uniref:Prepilin-type N-terminal cleavage/methylation domain-containing protein n=1 Tax=Tepidimonas taiwanensis TaxID=307486 RepID=A0A554X2F1_9BURK|nr:prepilin-type N-terminal cleavage/methylation domain-containing protein [Tepidimonas taiwanensis]MDM7462519.1 prepilin-type N-terminal cleavage/methylation domain-containing protein [Tepidimonas taiwanensis]TSE30012.1 hypothetical protein Ttaiw_02103 [Tepidimonas taiwanensis]UBQ04625.1 prepilin-type N-terminal cleavage/methylation domain-containing protein [Tepidimonas taiwanensis]
MSTHDTRKCTRITPLARPRGRGFSLVELLVALAIASVMILAVAGYAIGVRESSTQTVNTARNEDVTRLITELVARDIRSAGYSPCGTRANLAANGQTIEVFGPNPALPAPFTGLNNAMRIESAVLVRYANPDTVADVTVNGNTATLAAIPAAFNDASGYRNTDVLVCDTTERAVRTNVTNVNGNDIVLANSPNVSPTSRHRLAVIEERLWIYGSNDAARDCSANRCSIFLARAVTQNGASVVTREEYGTDVCPLTFQPDNAGNPQSVQLLGASRLNVNSNALNGCRGLNLTVARRN